MPRFKEIEHTADRAFRVTGRDMASLLENAARQCMRWMSPRVHSKQVEGVDRESLLVNWLNEILYLEQAHQLVTASII